MIQQSDWEPPRPSLLKMRIDLLSSLLRPPEASFKLPHSPCKIHKLRLGLFLSFSPPIALTFRPVFRLKAYLLYPILSVGRVAKPSLISRSLARNYIGVYHPKNIQAKDYSLDSRILQDLSFDIELDIDRPTINTTQGLLHFPNSYMEEQTLSCVQPSSGGPSRGSQLIIWRFESYSRSYYKERVCELFPYLSEVDLLCEIPVA